MRDILIQILEAIRALAPVQNTGSQESTGDSKSDTIAEEPVTKSTSKRSVSK